MLVAVVSPTCWRQIIDLSMVWIDDNFTKRRHGNDGIPNGWDSGFIRNYPDREAIWLSFYHLTCWLGDVSPIYRYTVVDVAPEKKQTIDIQT